MIFEELEGLCLINDVDVYTTYRVFLCEEKQGDQTNMEALLKPSALKSNTAVDIREQNGEKYSADLKPKNQARDVTLYFMCHGDGKTDFLSKFSSFIAFVKNGLNGTGWINLSVPDLPGKTFRMFATECSDYDNLTYMEDDLVVARFKIKFREPVPII